MRCDHWAGVKEVNSMKQPRNFFVHATAILDEPVSIGPGSKIWHFSHILPNTSIGEKCVIGQNVMIGPEVVIGDNCKIQNNVSLYKGIMVEQDVFIGPSAVFTNVKNPRAFINRKTEFQTTHIKRGATIGANATVVCGLTLGEYCLIGAGAVVTTSIPDFALFLGVPARQHGWVSKSGFVLNSNLTCPKDGSAYEIDAGVLRPL